MQSRQTWSKIPQVKKLFYDVYAINSEDETLHSVNAEKNCMEFDKMQEFRPSKENGHDCKVTYFKKRMLVIATHHKKIHE